MSYSTSSRSSRRRPPTIPIICCPDCGRKVKCWVSNTVEHTGWVFYRCIDHGITCNFWHWEREYVQYLVDNNVLRGDDAVEAIGWADDRRQDLQIQMGRKKFAEEWGRGLGGGSCSTSTPAVVVQHNGNEELVLRRLNELLVVGRELLLLLKIGVAILGFIVAMAALFLVKK